MFNRISANWDKIVKYKNVHCTRPNRFIVYYLNYNQNNVFQLLISNYDHFYRTQKLTCFILILIHRMY